MEHDDRDAAVSSDSDVESTDGTVSSHDETLPQDRSQWAARRHERRRQRGIRGVINRLRDIPAVQRWAIGVPVVLLVLVILLLSVEVASSWGRVHPGVRVAGVKVGGMTPERVARTLEDSVVPRLADPVVLTFEQQQWSVESTLVAATLDTTSAIDAAMAIGREGTFSTRTRDRISAWFKPVDIAAPVDGSEERIAAVIDEIASAIDRPPVDAGVVIEGTSATVTPSEVGLAVRREQVASGLLAAFAETDRTVEVDAGLVPVSITEEDAAKAAEDAETMMSAPVIITHGERRWDFAPEDIASWIAFRSVPAQEASSSASETQAGEVTSAASVSKEVAGDSRMVLEAYISATETSSTVTPKVGEAGRPATDAQFKVSSGTVTIVPSQDGVGPDIEALARELTVVLLSSDSRMVELRTTRVEPALSTQEAQAMGIKERYGTYTTTYDSGNKPRVNNIHTLAAAIDGTLVAPGETFSFNSTVGPRTAAKGYQEAPAIVNGKLVPQLGGGICQFGTTIFNAVFESGLPIVERKNHSFYISHYPKGRDATVSWGGPDFKFKNDTEHYVLIATGYTAGSVTVSIYGTNPGYAVSSKTGQWYDVTAHPVKEVPDPSLPSGTRIVEDSGVDGRKIVVTRTVTKNGAVVREDTFTSVYRPKEEVVRVGTMPVASPGTTSTAR